MRAAHRPGDTGLVTYGQAQLLEDSGLRPGYPYLWSLPARTLDPRLCEMVHDLRSPHRPDWIIEWLPVDTWDLDAHGHARQAITTRYREVGTVCGVGLSPPGSAAALAAPA